MSEMVERVAKTIFDVWARDAGLSENDRDWGEVVRVDHSIVALARKEARAAIEAMREPDIDMVQAGWDSRGEACDRYRAMIDAALK
jgi:hypothetical protein